MTGHTFLKRWMGTAFIVLAAAIVGSVQGAVIYVNALATGANNGGSWTDAYTSLQDGLSAALSGDEVWVAEGTYTPTVEVYGTGSRYKTFQLVNGVAVYGGFASSGDPGWADRDSTTHVTILSGDIGTPGDNTDNCYHVFCHTGLMSLDSTAVLDGFSIVGGNADGSSLDSAGGGMYNYKCSPMVSNCYFTFNSATMGGGMMNEGVCQPAINECTFVYNDAQYGGGMYNAAGCLAEITDCEFSFNSSTSGGGGMYNINQSDVKVFTCNFGYNTSTNSAGGGMYNYTSRPEITDCTFLSNTASSSGAMYNYSGSNPTITNCTFMANIADYNGGAISNASSDPNILDCLFYMNDTVYTGGAIENIVSNPYIENCQFIRNTADGGAAIYDFQSGSVVFQSVFSGNQASKGAGIYMITSQPVLTNCTFSANSATNGSAIACDTTQGSPPSTVEAANCIVWDNSSEIWNNDSSTITVTYSDVYGGYAGAGNINIDPGFFDADGEDDVPGTDDDNLRLTADSPCIDAGDNGELAASVTNDLAGEPRYFDDPATADTGVGTAPIVDMGAYEIDTRVLEITKLTLKAGRTAGGSQDQFTIRGNFVNYQAGDYVNGDPVILELGSVVSPLSVQAVFKQIGKKEKYLYRATVSGLTKVMFDLDKGTFNIMGKNVDLTGLEAPIEVRLTLGNYVGRATAADSGANDVINGRRPVPLQYMSGYRNAFEVNAKFRSAMKTPDVGILTLSGSIAAGDLSAAADTGSVTITCGGQTFIIAAGEFSRTGTKRKYVYRGHKPGNSSTYLASGQIDLDKCTFKLMFKDFDVSAFSLPETIQLEFDQFDATAYFSY